MERSDKNNLANITDTAREIDYELVFSESENQIKVERQDSNSTPPQQSDRFIVSISPEICFTNRGSIEDVEVDQFTETCDRQATLKEQQLARALRYALSIIASYESNIENNFVNLPIGFCRGQLFYSARVDILQIAGMKVDADLYNLDDMNF